MKCLLLLVCFAAACQAIDEWSLFKKLYNKDYSNGLEELKRIKIFTENKQKIEEHNARYAKGLESHSVKMNRFGDMETHEFKAMMNGLRMGMKKPSTKIHQVTNLTIPTTVDWRNQGAVTHVKDQGQCGSCWSFSTTGSLEGQTYLKTGNLISLSEQNLIDCSGDYGNQGCNGGFMDSAFQYIQANRGIDTESFYPYTAEDGSCKFSAIYVGATDNGFVDVSSGDEIDLLDAVANVGPISIAIDASNWSFQFYSEGVYNEPGCSSTDLDHGVLAVGYGTDSGTEYWLVKNSWGSSWGLDGYIKMSRNQDNQCGVATMASYPTV